MKNYYKNFKKILHTYITPRVIPFVILFFLQLLDFAVLS